MTHNACSAGLKWVLDDRTTWAQSLFIPLWTYTTPTQKVLDDRDCKNQDGMVHCFQMALHFCGLTLFWYTSLSHFNRWFLGWTWGATRKPLLTISLQGQKRSLVITKQLHFSYCYLLLKSSQGVDNMPYVGWTADWAFVWEKERSMAPLFVTCF